MEANERNWIIYMYTFPNGKRYIGKTSRSLKDRQEGSNWAGYNHSTILMKAVHKYGIENIKQDILFENVMQDEYAARLEQIYILLFKTNCLKFNNPSYGYNMTDGGEGTLGHHHTDESKKKMSESKKGKPGSTTKPVYCIELDRVFHSAIDAEKYTDVSKKTISLCCLGKNKSTGGGNTNFDMLHWIFEKDMSNEMIEEVMHRPKIVFQSNTSSGVNGVYWDKSRNKWAVQIGYNGKKHSLGRFTDLNDAIVVRLSAEKMYYGDFAPQANLFNKYNIK